MVKWRPQMRGNASGLVRSIQIGLFFGLIICSSVALAQSVTDMVEQFQTLRQQASALNSEGRHAEAIEMLEDLLPLAVELGPSFAANVTRGLADATSYEGDHAASAQWYVRTLEYHADNPRAGPSTVFRDALMAGQAYESAGQLEDAMRYLTFAGGLANEPGESLVDPYMAYQAWFQAALVARGLERPDDITATYRQASEWIERAGRSGSTEDVMLDVCRIEYGAEYATGSEEKVLAMIDVYRHPRFRELPDRLSLAGRYAAFLAYGIGRFDLLEPLAADIFAEAARFEEQLGDDAKEHDIDEAYTQTAMHLGIMYGDRGEDLLAAETFEHALYAYPDARLSGGLRDLLFQTYEELGIDPEDRRELWDPALGVSTPVVEVDEQPRVEEARADAESRAVPAPRNESKVPAEQGGGWDAIRSGGGLPVFLLSGTVLFGVLAGAVLLIRRRCHPLARALHSAP